MSIKHPIIAITGSSGAGTSSMQRALASIFNRQSIKSVSVEGDSFHRYDRNEMHDKLEATRHTSDNFSHFGPEANEFEKLQALFKSYGENGTGKTRCYLHSSEDARRENERLGLQLEAGQFTPWEDIERETDLLFYEGLHGLVKTESVDLSPYVDLKVGVVPIVNLEWIQKIHRDIAERGYREEVIVDNILRRMPDYVKYITPQFTGTDINFQRVATVDTSNPFIARDLPTDDESFVIIRFNKPDIRQVDFSNLLSMLAGSFMSRRNTIVIPGGKLEMAMEIIFNPIVADLIDKRRSML